mgnify:CR=1 FL=1
MRIIFQVSPKDRKSPLAIRDMGLAAARFVYRHLNPENPTATVPKPQTVDREGIPVLITFTRRGDLLVERAPK